MTIFVDRIALSQRHAPGGFPDLAGMRTISYRQAGDIERDGSVCPEENPFAARAFGAWVQGSHETRLQLLSDDGFVGLRGNPGRFGRPDNIFNLDLPATVTRSNEIVQAHGLPIFTPGTPFSGKQDEPQIKWTGARVWEIHITQNYATGSASNAAHVLDWLDTQSVSRVKKSRLGKSTVTWGSIKYAQVEAYIKADELLAHAKPDDRDAIRKSHEYQWALENGIVRFEVKLAKSYLQQHDLSYLGAWDMGTVHRIFRERTEILNRVKVEVDEFDPALLPARCRLIAAAWLKGEDVTALVSRATFFRHAKVLREYGIDIAQRRNIHSFPVRVRQIDLTPLAVPDWYSLKAA